MEFDRRRFANLMFKIAEFGATDFEKHFNPNPTRDWAFEKWLHVIILVIGYLLFCKFGVEYMSNQKAWDLRYPLALWNGLLSFFSFIGVFRTVPYLIGYTLIEGYEGTICKFPVETFGSGVTGFWVMLFIFSKIPELFDTVFIVLRKRPLIFLHWYHHATVLLYCWNAYTTRAAAGLYFVCMNYSVHAVMYLYYCAQALKIVPRNFPAVLITTAQISQMFIGTAVCLSAWYFKLLGRPCSNADSNLIAGAVMYGSYFVLFAQFFFTKYPDASKGVDSSVMRKIKKGV